MNKLDYGRTVRELADLLSRGWVERHRIEGLLAQFEDPAQAKRDALANLVQKNRVMANLWSFEWFAQESRSRKAN